MTGSGSLLLGAVFLLTLVIQQTGAANPGVFDLPKKIQEFVDHKSRRFNVPVNWWNMYGNHSHLIEWAEKYRHERGLRPDISSNPVSSNAVQSKPFHRMTFHQMPFHRTPFHQTPAWHSRFLKLVGGAPPGFWKFLTCIAAKHQLTEDKLEAMLSSQEPPRRKKAIAARKEKVRLFYENRRSKAVGDFLRD
uniref:Putative conserved secreted protein n=1 Tax=Ixodes scapularis TaxID=6945 RepID=A0A4D5S1M0_IXOSC